METGRGKREGQMEVEGKREKRQRDMERGEGLKRGRIGNSTVEGEMRKGERQRGQGYGIGEGKGKEEMRRGKRKVKTGTRKKRELKWNWEQCRH
jgi:hypothetical protein